MLRLMYEKENLHQADLLIKIICTIFYRTIAENAE